MSQMEEPSRDRELSGRRSIPSAKLPSGDAEGELYPQTPCSDGWLFLGGRGNQQPEMGPVEEAEGSVHRGCSKLQNLGTIPAALWTRPAPRAPSTGLALGTEQLLEVTGHPPGVLAGQQEDHPHSHSL